jgi:uncharacterized membrane protein YdcZ (DUF606 family)
VTRVQRTGRVLAALGAAAIAWLTLQPEPDAAVLAASTPLWCLVCGERGGVDVILNLLLFTPLGLGLRLAGLSWRRALVTSALLSLGVELLQLTVVEGRDASLSDLLSNTGGAALGAALAARLDTLVHPSPDVAQRLLLGCGAGWLSLLALSAWLQGPWVGGGALTSIWAGGAGPEPYPGQVRSVRRDGAMLPADGPLPDGESVRAALREGTIALEAAVQAGPPVHGRRWIYVIDESGARRLFLSQQGRSAVFGMPARSIRFRLNPPTVVLPDAFPGAAGAEVTLRAGQRDRQVWLESAYAGGSSRIALALSPAHGWALLTPYGLGLGRTARMITGALLFALVAPLGYWAGATGRPHAAFALGGILFLGLAGLPALSRFPAVHWSEWLAVVAAAAAGWALQRAAAYLQLRCGSPSTSESFSS